MVGARKQKLDWRKHLTPDEAAIIKSSDLLAEAIDKMRDVYERKYTRERALIVNKCCQRAKAAKLQPEAAHG